MDIICLLKHVIGVILTSHQQYKGVTNNMTDMRHISCEKVKHIIW